MDLESNQAKTGWLKRCTPIFTIVALCWLTFIVNNLILGGRLASFGIIPRHISGLPGIVFSPFLHASFSHLAANTLPLLILGSVLCFRNRTEFLAVTALGAMLSGALVWLMGRGACHIGASALIFCFFGYLSSLAIFQRKLGTLLLSAACILVYGGMLKGLLPTANGVSWEGHLAGLASGIVLAAAGSKLKSTDVAATAVPVPGAPKIIVP
ncbi:MAG TPA: rhomboid family intramembrane serine protease [Candidatus Dormibacteraeota bacterium]|nr:rhomboid family intramembrane serine protease [Candidatus Dormibacteraeota bacterium]